jgi:hypothetical protein
LRASALTTISFRLNLYVSLPLKAYFKLDLRRYDSFGVEVQRARSRLA